MPDLGTQLLRQQVPVEGSHLTSGSGRVPERAAPAIEEVEPDHPDYHQPFSNSQHSVQEPDSDEGKQCCAVA